MKNNFGCICLPSFHNLIYESVSPVGQFLARFLLPCHPLNSRQSLDTDINTIKETLRQDEGPPSMVSWLWASVRLPEGAIWVQETLSLFQVLGQFRLHEKEPRKLSSRFPGAQWVFPVLSVKRHLGGNRVSRWFVQHLCCGMLQAMAPALRTVAVMEEVADASHESQDKNCS